MSAGDRARPRPLNARELITLGDLDGAVEDKDVAVGLGLEHQDVLGSAGLGFGSTWKRDFSWWRICLTLGLVGARRRIKALYSLESHGLAWRVSFDVLHSVGTHLAIGSRSRGTSRLLSERKE